MIDAAVAFGRVFSSKKIAFLFGKIVYNNYCYAGVVKLVDTMDSKSIALKSVSVRVRPPVPS